MDSKWEGMAWHGMSHCSLGSCELDGWQDLKVLQQEMSRDDNGPPFGLWIKLL